MTDESGNVNNILEIGYDNENDRLSIQSSLRRGLASGSIQTPQSSKGAGGQVLKLNRHNLRILE
jgi:hypothetical protein